MEGQSEAAALEAEEREGKEEEARQKAAQEQATAAGKQLSIYGGGVPPTQAKMQITGGEIEIPAPDMPKRDEQVELQVIGWVKTIKDTTETKNGYGTRTAIIVVDDAHIVGMSGTAGGDEE